MTSLTFAFVYLLYSTSRLRALDFYRLVVDEGAVLVKPCIRQLSPQYDRQTKFWCPNEMKR